MSIQDDFNRENIIYKITKVLDLSGETLNIPRNAILDFQGGKIINGTVNLDRNMILPNGCIIENYITANITGSYMPGQCLYDTTLKRPKWWNGTVWVGSNGNNNTIRVAGTFNEKPKYSDGINSGFAYFCTDKHTPENSTNGMMIYHRGSDVWIDALGRVVDDSYPVAPPAISGTTEERTAGVSSGYQYFDTTLNKPIWKTDSGWVDATGTEV